MAIPGISVKHSHQVLFKELLTNDPRALILERCTHGYKIGFKSISRAGVLATGKPLKSPKLELLVLR